MPDEHVSLRVLPMQLDAACYNDARLAVLRLGRPLRLSLPTLRAVDMLLDDERWVCVARDHNDHGIFACTDFVREEGAALHRPVNCRVHIYHVHAGMLLRSALDGLAQQLRERLATDARPVSAARSAGRRN